jgi:proteasome lid subunit RPN8/RPN11
MLISDAIKSAIIAHAHAVAPNEACGVIIDNDLAIACRNIADNPEQDFKLAPADYAKACTQGTITALYHSHPHADHPDTFTFADISSCQAAKLPYILYHVPTGGWDYYDPSDINPYLLQLIGHLPTDHEFYLGRQYVWGRSDCYNLLRDYMKGMLGIEMGLFARTSDPQEWKKPGWNRYVEGLPGEGFVQVKDGSLKLHDVLLFALDGKTAHHAGILVNETRMWFIQHLQGRLSERSVYGGFWQDRLHSVWRHSQ